MPNSRLEFWRTKLEANVERDDRQVAALEAAGWTVLTLWECETRSDDTVAAFVDDVIKRVEESR
jgi:DNA mismatch endonuclease (patch repair protein)